MERTERLRESSCTRRNCAKQYICPLEISTLWFCSFVHAAEGAIENKTLGCSLTPEAESGRIDRPQLYSVACCYILLYIPRAMTCCCVFDAADVLSGANVFLSSKLSPACGGAAPCRQMVHLHRRRLNSGYSLTSVLSSVPPDLTSLPRPYGEQTSRNYRRP